MKPCFSFFVGIIFFCLTHISFCTEQADLILFNGKIITVDSQDNVYQAIAICGERILAVGNDTEIKALAGPQCQMIDLNGKTVTPGLIDSHYHLMYYGAQFWDGYLDIRYPIVKSKADLLQVVGDYAKQLQPGEWISGNQGFTLQRYETIDRWEIDSVTPDNPAYLRHASGQYCVANSKALEIAKVDKNTQNPPSSLIVHDSTGEPTGILSHYGAENLVAKFATGYGDRSNEQKLKDIEYGQMLCLQAGYTSVQDVIIGSLNDVLLYKQFDDEGRFKVRLYAMILIDTEEEANYLTSITLPATSKYFKYGGWKLAQDGGIAARTTLFYDKSLYAAEISYPYHPQDELNRLVKLLHNTGLQVAVHVSGDKGIDMTLTAFEQAMLENPRSDPRHRIEHGIFPSASALQRMKNSNIILSTQPQWITWYGDGFAEATNETVMNQMLPLKTMLDMGIHIAFGCDVPASIYQEPKWAFAGATLRKTGAGTLLSQSEKLNMHEALRIHTMGSAYAGFADTSTGSLEVGKLADLVVWNKDLYNMSQTDAVNLAAELTIVGGKIVYDSQNPVYIANYGHQNIPSEFKLEQNYPNPFNPVTTIKYSLPTSTKVQLKVYDILGNEITTLVDAEQEPGNYSVEFSAQGGSASGGNGYSLSSGIYFYRIQSNDFSNVKKILILK